MAVELVHERPGQRGRGRAVRRDAGEQRVEDGGVSRSREARDELVGCDGQPARLGVRGGRARLRVRLRNPRDSLSSEFVPAGIDAIEEDAAGEQLERRVELEGVGRCVLGTGDERAA